MVLTRVADDKAVKLQRQGRLGAYPPTKGQEASQIGPALAMGPNDWLVWAFRELGGLIYRGVPLWRLYLYWMGNEEGSSYPEGVRATPSVVPVGSQIPHAVGIAYAAKLRKEDTAVVCFFGDGGTSEGDFHEGLNFAGVMQHPERLRLPEQPVGHIRPAGEADRLEDHRPEGGGLWLPWDTGRRQRCPGPLRRDQGGGGAGQEGRGTDAHRVVHLPHGRPHHLRRRHPLPYWSKELKEWAERDPITRFRVYLTNKGLWDEEKEKALLEEVSAMVEEEVKKAESFPRPTLDDCFRHTYATCRTT